MAALAREAYQCHVGARRSCDITDPAIWCYTAGMPTLTLKLPPDLAAWLEQRARALKRPKSEIARDALAAQRRRGNDQSVTARAGDLVGQFASGRHDASHKRHLKGFGR